MLIKYLLIILFVVIVAQASVFTSRKIHKVRHSASKILDAYLPSNELFAHAKQLATNFTVSAHGDAANKIRDMLNSDYDYITGVYKDMIEKSTDDSKLPPAAEWILDNYYIVERHIKEIKMDLEADDFSKLPVLSEGARRGFPRIYAIAEELVAHRDAQVEEDVMIRFIQSYQEVEHLRSLELGALPVMIKLVLIENIAYICRHIRHSVKEYDYAKKYCEYVMSKLGDRRLAEEKINRYFSNSSRINDTFVSQLISNFKSQGSDAIVPLSILDANLERRGINASVLTDTEHRKQSAHQIYMGNSIMGIVSVSAMDWTSIFEYLSAIEQLLHLDPSGTYANMDAASRDLYRKCVKNIANACHTGERTVVVRANELASCAVDYEKTHVGYYLIGDGKALLYKRLSGRNKYTERANGAFARYMLCITTLTAAISLGLFFTYLPINWLCAIIITVLFTIPASEIAIKLINYCVTHSKKKAKTLPKLEFKDGIPVESATFVIIPTLLFDEKGVCELLKNLESFHLANRSDNLFFGIVGDFKDSDKAVQDGEYALIAYTEDRIAELNERYSTDKNIFYLFCRERSFNENENRWMGRERKRGAICDFVALIKSGEVGNFVNIDKSLHDLPAIKYIITLDADTRLHQNTAIQLVGAMAHPLNRLHIDSEKGIVTHGYGIMQPRVDVDIESANKTFFTKVFAGQGGIDQYSSAVSDVYQDLFGEGIFTGKGIFDVDAFYAALKDIPDNTVLSHDLLEGSYLRCALLSDVAVSDGYPARYASHMSRLHRWARGDWQLLPWLHREIRLNNNKNKQNPLSRLSKWKIADNLRRTLLPFFVLLTLIIAFFIVSPQKYIVLAAALLTLGFSLISSVAHAISSGYFNFTNQRSNATIIYGLKGTFIEFILLLTTLPYHAYLMLDAILRTLYRMCISHRHMLEWVTSAEGERRSKNDIFSYCKKMWFAPALAVVITLSAILFADISTIMLTSIFAALWFFSPVAAFLISIEEKEEDYQLEISDTLNLRILSRQTWRYFEDFASASDNFLPPDNVQIDPPNGVAHRTSPTNIGMLLIAYLAARDFGYLTTPDMLSRINATLNTIDKLSKWNGHLYNWYNTQTLDILHPAYVSTVDSGNYISYVITLREGLREMIGKPVIDFAHVSGLIDTISAANIQHSELVIHDAELKSITAENFSHNRLKSAIDTLMTSDFSQSGDWMYKINDMCMALLDTLSRNDDNTNILIHSTISRLSCIIDETSFVPLFDKHRQLFSIGYNVAEEKLTRSYYDLLASEARQTSFIAIAKGELDSKHWFKLGRSLCSDDGYRGLVSWTGTMFEYLMPLLIMKKYKNTLLDETYWFAVREQIKYARKRTGEKHNGIWGISESGFFAFDLDLNYQYKAFGTPILGLKRGLGSDVVITPYASVMALMVNPAASLDNIKKMQMLDLQDIYGFYEAVDFTPKRLAGNDIHAVVKSYMVHHQGMSFMALCNVLHQNIMQKRFSNEPMVRAVDYLLCERVPTRVIMTSATKYETPQVKQPKRNVFYCTRSYKNPQNSFPQAHILSNRTYSVILNDCGGGYSKWNDINVTRWRPNLVNSYCGSFIYISQEGTNSWWSSTTQPCDDDNDSCTVVFSCDKAEYFRSDGQLDTHTEITVSAQDNAELRRVTVTNHSNNTKTIALTSYQEIVLAPHSSDESHPTFSNLFIRTEYEEKYNALLASRRPRTKHDNTLWAFHCIAIDGEQIGQISYETDRCKFLGRNGTPASPLAMRPGHPLENADGAVLDPIFAIRCKLQIPVGGTVGVSFVTGISYSREEALTMSSKYCSPSAVANAFELTQTRTRLENTYLELGEWQEDEILSLLPHLLYSSPQKEKYADIITRNKLSQCDLWTYGISGDVPIILFRIDSSDHIGMLDRILKTHEYFLLKGLECDLVVLCYQEASYTRHLFESVNERVAVSHARDMQNRRGGVFVRNTDTMTQDGIELLIKVAHVVVTGDAVRLVGAENYNRHKKAHGLIRTQNQYTNAELIMPTLTFFNGYGGFDTAENEYVIHLKDGQSTPLPWSNVIANAEFGCIASESGGGYTWYQNSRENKLTPWKNDPVCDIASECCYIKDTHSGDIFTATARPINDGGSYIIRHGLGYTIYQHNALGIEATQTIFVPPDEPVKIIDISLYNPGDTTRHFSATYVLKPLLGANLDANRFVRSWCIGDALCMENTYNGDFSGNICFLSCSEPENSVTTDASDFVIDKNGIPSAIYEAMLSGKIGTGYESVAAMQTICSIEPKSTKKIIFVFGSCGSKEEVTKLTEKYRGTIAADFALSRTKNYWIDLTGGVRVNTPDESFNIMLNSWLLYQTIASRLFARSAFYQCGGAFGFRDQLQDVLSLLHHHPTHARKQIILHAAHQFKEGDVQHWWHAVKSAEPGADRGIRTKFSDDLLWLVYVTCQYISTTQDYSILDEEAPFIDAELLDDITDERYSIPRLSGEVGSVYEHCLRALKRGLKLGEHGLVLMGSGDWNDGMSTVGNEGKGESVWLSWFVYDTLTQFIPVLRLKNDNRLAEEYENFNNELAANLDAYAWDGNWYRRAYFDDGTPLGSVINDECSIDAIAQAWSVISGAGTQSRSKAAMDALDRHLVKRENGLIMLLTPPFNCGDSEPGYIKSYVPGVRENGGQYTHASAWAIMAMAMMGDERAWEYYNMINPINHARTPIEIMQYKTEPYVMAADVYTNPQHMGRGGWTWYTGSSAWFYKVAVEHLLGITRQGDKLYINPFLPPTWPQLSIAYRFGKSTYHISIINKDGISRGTCVLQSKDCDCVDGYVVMKDDGKEYYVTVVLVKE